MRSKGVTPNLVRRLALAALASSVLLGTTVDRPATAGDTDHGVFVLLAADVEGAVADVTTRLTEALESGGWHVLSEHATGTPDGCPFEARVLTVHSDGYATTLRPYGPQTAFALPLRLVVFEDEQGVHVGATNPLNLNRTIVDERVPAWAWTPWRDRLVDAVHAGFAESSLTKEYGQLRDEGRIGKTFGIMAGGPFVEKIEVVASVPAAGQEVGVIAKALYEGFGEVAGAWRWELEPVYLLELPELDAAVLGVTGAPMEADAFEIVGEGGDDSRESMACPGLDHAPAFPVELVVVRRDERVVVQLVDEMFRMKMFFEDAGKIAVAKNMGMPGDIEDEIRAKVEAVLSPGSGPSPR